MARAFTPCNAINTGVGQWVVLRREVFFRRLTPTCYSSRSDEPHPPPLVGRFPRPVGTVVLVPTLLLCSD